MARKWRAVVFVAAHFFLTITGFFLNAAWQMAVLDTGGTTAPPLLILLHYLVLALTLPVFLPIWLFGDAIITFDPWHGVGLLFFPSVALLNSVLAFVVCYGCVKLWQALRRRTNAAI